jgi:exonuclease III
MARREVHLTNVTKLPSGRAIAADYKGIQLINIYAPSGTARKTEKEHFYNTELPQILQAGHKDLLIGGDFNCVPHPADTTGHFQTSRALTELVLCTMGTGSFPGVKSGRGVLLTTHSL